MLLTGHAGEVFTAAFSPDGKTVASGSHDKHIFLWTTYGECRNFMLIQGKVDPAVNKSLLDDQNCALLTDGGGAIQAQSGLLACSLYNTDSTTAVHPYRATLQASMLKLASFMSRQSGLNTTSSCNRPQERSA